MRFAVPLLPRWVRWVGVGAVVATIFYFSIVTVPKRPPQASPLWDKQLHFASYAALTLALAYATVRYRRRPWLRASAVIVLVAVFGGAIELLQGVVPYRYTSPMDYLANVIGVLFASVWFIIERRLEYSRIANEGELEI